MKSILIQHIIKQLKKHKPSTRVQDDDKDHGTVATIFVLALALIILIIAFN